MRKYWAYVLSIQIINLFHFLFPYLILISFQFCFLFQSLFNYNFQFSCGNQVGEYLGVSGMGAMRVFRTFRCLRPLRAMSRLQGLKVGKPGKLVKPARLVAEIRVLRNSLVLNILQKYLLTFYPELCLFNKVLCMSAQKLLTFALAAFHADNCDQNIFWLTIRWWWE